MASHNLTTLCQDPEYIFNTFESLYACTKISTTITHNFTNLVHQCVSDYCKNPTPDLNACPSQGEEFLPFGFEVGTTPWDFWLDTGGYCQNINYLANTDLGGPGVFISYLIQIGLLMLIWLIIRFFRIVPKLFRQISWIGQRAKRHRFSQLAMGHSGKINNALDEQHFVLKSILVEFQETQCFFMIACESVILISLRHNGIFAATNMAVVVADHTLAGIVGAAGIFPNVVGLWTLQRKKMCSAWIFFLSTCTLIAAEVAIYKISDVPSTSDMTKLHGTFPESCGGHPPPMRFCAWHTLETSLVTVDFFKQYVNPYCLILYGITLIIWAWPFAKKLLWSSAFKKFHPHLSQTSDQCRSIYSTTWFKLVRGLAMFLAELSILPFCALYIACFIGRFNLQFVDWNSWGFGQFLALTTWAAVICKWIYWTIFGTESYSETRIAEPYHIVKDGTAEYNSDRESDDDDNKQLFPKARQSAAYEPGRDVESGETGSNTGLLRADNKTIYPEDHERKNDEYDNDIAMARI